MSVEIVSDEREREATARRVADVAKWLQSHKVTASASTDLSVGDAGNYLDAIASESGDITWRGLMGTAACMNGYSAESPALQHSSMFAFLMH